MEDWSPDAPAYALAWIGGTTRNHKGLWQEFLAHEALTDQTLSGPVPCASQDWTTPRVSQTLLGSQCIDNLLALWENFLNYQHEKTSGTALLRVQICKHNGCRPTGLMDDTTLQLTILTECPSELSVLGCGMHERRADLVLQADSATGTAAACDERSHLALEEVISNGWMSGYVSADGQPSPKRGCSFMR